MPAGNARAVRSGVDASTASSVARLKRIDVGLISRLTARAAARIRASSARAAAKNAARLSAAVDARSTGGPTRGVCVCGAWTGAVLTVPGVGPPGGSAVPAGEPAPLVHPAASAAAATANTRTAVRTGRKLFGMTAPHASGAGRTADNRGDAWQWTKVVLALRRAGRPHGIAGGLRTCRSARGDARSRIPVPGRQPGGRQRASPSDLYWASMPMNEPCARAAILLVTPPDEAEPIRTGALG